jgi:hypothetical protein
MIYFFENVTSGFGDIGKQLGRLSWGSESHRVAGGKRETTASAPGDI